MKTPRTFFAGVAVGVLLVILLLFAGCLFIETVWFQRMVSEVHETSHPGTLEEMRKAMPWVDLPASASNIWYATSTMGASLYRFDASLTDCLAYAQSLIATNNSSERASWAVPTQLVAITTSPEVINHDFLKGYRLNATEWFDVENIGEGWRGSGPPGGLSYFWIDSKRGRFYYYWTE